jgi:hypothetical protein
MEHPNLPRPNSKDVVTDRRIPFNYNLADAPIGQKMILLQEGGVAVFGMLSGRPEKDKGIIAWCAMPVRDKDEERRRGYLRPRPPGELSE